MGPSHTEPLRSSTNDQPISSIMSSNQRRRNEGEAQGSQDQTRTDGTDSWIEISSQPSSSISSTHVPPPPPSVERLARRINIEHQGKPPRSTSATGSSQDEYEESSSESDPILSSSNEDIKNEEDDDDRTALGVRPTETVFTPPVNAFSHPPTSRRSSDTYFTRPNSTPSSAIRTDRQRQRPHLHRERTSGSYQPDHDAALRASLTTLLSCAAAVRPKEEKVQERQFTTRQPAHPIMRMVPESELDRPRTNPKAVKRRSRESSKDRHAKKMRAMKTASLSEDTLSPTLTAWMISAGVVLVFSAISFSAGYAWGKEVGRIEGEMGLAGRGCGQEVVSGGGLRKLRWSSGNSSIRA